jgi:hypothetical protein
MPAIAAAQSKPHGASRSEEGNSFCRAGVIPAPKCNESPAVKSGSFQALAQGRNVNYQTVDKRKSPPDPQGRATSLRPIRDSSAFLAVIDEDGRSAAKVTF